LKPDNPQGITILLFLVIFKVYTIILKAKSIIPKVVSGDI